MKNLIKIPRITDPRGNLAVIEKEVLPYAIKRVYYLHDVPSGAYRGGHAHKECKELLIAVSGSFEVVLDNGKEKERVMLNKPNQGLLIDVNIWRELENFSSGAVCLVLASHEYDEDDYIRNYETYKSLKS
ncbi:FdtA/QdtA family cupin domain-containing protein [Dokdonia genika]|jgi:mannose-6-phosphate isomerase-like protein (cupin superfamily)|uniref:FdtA/QdtA family cupin domain-containing protein n=1 Tax=Dokdonia genika TaxID=308113 RepID=A0ABV9LBB9_9FLAO|nr:FdtA/QdtA family cupin domain-containing protein [Dokdonia donghaensis]